MAAPLLPSQLGQNGAAIEELLKKAEIPANCNLIGYTTTKVMMKAVLLFQEDPDTGILLCEGCNGCFTNQR